MPKRSSKRHDLNELAKTITDRAAGEGSPESEEAPEDAAGKNPAAVALGRLGGKKGGPARAAKLTPEQRRESAKKAAAARWNTARRSDKK
jgi:hypothetical protein